MKHNARAKYLHAKWKHHPRWGLRRRLTFVFVFVALAAVFLSTWFTLGAVYSALFSAHEGFSPFWKNQPLGNDPAFEQARAIFRRVFATAIIAGGMSFILAAVVAAVVTRLLTRPLIALTDGARRLAQGERGLRLKVRPSRDELQSLTEAFNSLVTGLEKQEAWRRDLVADIAHDLRTPLSVLRSEIEAMQDGLATADQQGLARLHQQVILLGRLVEDLQTLSLAESGGLNLHLETVNLKNFLQSVIQGFLPRARAAHLDIHLNEVADVTLRIDFRQMTRVMNNLLDNALRYGKSPLEISALATTDTCVITLRDYGPGIAEEALERIFERFYKADSARVRSADSGGSGLGLSIARAIVQAHHGTLTASNHPEGGAVFEITLAIQT